MLSKDLVMVHACLKQALAKSYNVNMGDGVPGIYSTAAARSYQRAD